MKIPMEGTNLWYDSNEEASYREFIREQEHRYWKWHFSGQRTIDMFGVEGAKAALARQYREDRKRLFNHKSRGKK